MVTFYLEELIQINEKNTKQNYGKMVKGSPISFIIRTAN